MSTSSQDKNFGSEFLDQITNFVGREFDVQDVFDEEKIIAYCASKKPEEVFDEDALQSWAESNGYAKEK